MNEKREGQSLFPVLADDENCVGCNRCMRVCPVETANTVVQMRENSFQVRIKEEQCILCGSCVDICEHGVRGIRDDLHNFLDALQKGEEMAVMVAPSIRSSIPQWRQLLTWLRSIGVSAIYDVSLGADICIWGHLRYLEKKPGPIITQPCPVIVRYCRCHQQELLPFLSPVHSPMSCTAILMRKEGIQGKIASISPCLAKGEEHRETGLADYNITFVHLLKYLEEQGISLPEEEGGFDHPEAGPGSLFPLPGGLKENLELLSNRPLHVEKMEGNLVYRYLDLYGKTPKEHLPDVFDVLNCTDGCMIGSGSAEGNNIFQMSKQMNQMRKEVISREKESRARLEEFDCRFQLDDFLCSYTPFGRHYGKVSEEAINEAFLAMNKHDFVGRNFNCGACGSNSCRDMARKIVHGVNIPQNCVIKARDEAKREKERNAEYLSLVRNIGDELFSIQDEFYSAEVQESLKILSEAVDCAAVAIWRRVGEEDSSNCERVFGWYGDTPDRIAILNKWPDAWLEQLKKGDRILANSKKDYPDLFPKDVVTLFIVPIHIRGRFWGFVDAISTEERSFNPEEASLLEAVGILLISGMLERELNASLITAKEEALSGTRAKSDFLSRMSHEMRTPMNAIIGMTHIGKNAETAERKDYCLGRIEGASSHLLAVINDILDISKIEADKFELDSTCFHLEEMLQSAVNVVNFRMDEKSQIFTIHLDPMLPEYLEGDDQRLIQVLTNLLSNAVKFTPEKGHISLSVKKLSSEGSHCTLLFTVTDTGIGIPKEQQERLFYSFEQAESGTARKFGGTGLGLAISKRIVELMEGEIWIESDVGEGASFLFTVQLELGSPWQEPTGKKELLDGQRILVVDDAPEILDFFQEVCGTAGILCDVAPDAETALTTIEQSNTYTVYFIDYVLPGANGLALAKEILEKQKESCTVILFTGLEQQDIKEQARQIGVNQVLTKPLFPSQILDTIRKSMEQERDTPDVFSEEDSLGDLKGFRVLLAEDIEVNREIVLAVLEPAQLVIDCAENGRIALEKFRADPSGYDLLLMDMQMPEMDGCQATEAIRALDGEYSKQVPIIAMTANVFREDVERCLAAGMNDHIGKPLDYEELITKLRKYLL